MIKGNPSPLSSPTRGSRGFSFWSLLAILSVFVGAGIFLQSNSFAQPTTARSMVSQYMPSPDSLLSQLKNDAMYTYSTCQVTEPSSTSSLTSSNSSTTKTDICSTSMGQAIEEPRAESVSHLKKNPVAHIFPFPENTRNSRGQRPVLCVPHKNGNKQFGGLLTAAWKGKPVANNARGVYDDIKKWEVHQLSNKTEAHRESHVYFIARDPYSRLLSLYLHKVQNACISTGQKGCGKEQRFRGANSKTSFKEFVKRIEKRFEKKKSLGKIEYHLHLQVENCLTTTLAARQVTILRLEEQSCWFPCLVKQTGVNTTVLESGWESFSGTSCYYTATGICKDMLQSLDPRSVGVTTGNVHATGASTRLLEHYDAETAAIVSRLYADDFRILGYPLWDGLSRRF